MVTEPEKISVLKAKHKLDIKKKIKEVKKRNKELAYKRVLIDLNIDQIR